MRDESPSSAPLQPLGHDGLSHDWRQISSLRSAAASGHQQKAVNCYYKEREGPGKREKEDVNLWRIDWTLQRIAFGWEISESHVEVFAQPLPYSQCIPGTGRGGQRLARGSRNFEMANS